MDAAGDVLAAGRTQNEGAGWDFTVVKFSALNGTELWRQVIDGTSNDRDEAFAVAVDNAGDVVVAGGIVNDTGFVEFAVIKFAGAVGTEQVASDDSGSLRPSRFPAVLPNGELVAAGYFPTVGGVTANSIARWDGSAWSAMGTWMGARLPDNLRPVLSRSMGRW